jgi:hypothetical protein
MMTSAIRVHSDQSACKTHSVRMLCSRYKTLALMVFITPQSLAILKLVLQFSQGIDYTHSRVSATSIITEKLFTDKSS